MCETAILQSRPPTTLRRYSDEYEDSILPEASEMGNTAYSDFDFLQHPDDILFDLLSGAAHRAKNRMPLLVESEMWSRDRINRCECP